MNDFDNYFGTEQESIYSNDHKESEKYRQFLKYLSDKGVALGIVKCNLVWLVLLSLRRNDELPAAPIEALTDYFGAYNSHKTGELSNLSEEVERLKVENSAMANEIEEIAELIEQKKIEKMQAEEAARIAAEEEEAKKKGGKKGPAGAAKKK